MQCTSICLSLSYVQTSCLKTLLVFSLKFFWYSMPPNSVHPDFSQIIIYTGKLIIPFEYVRHEKDINIKWDWMGGEEGGKIF